ncbi:exopolyphosphatase [soil metagenome]
MLIKHLRYLLTITGSFFCLSPILVAQNSLSYKLKESAVYAGIEVGSKGVKMSLIEVKKDLQKNSSFIVLKDTAVNTDFISFTQTSFQATLSGFTGLYKTALNKFNIDAGKIFTVVSSGVKVQAQKSGKMRWVNNLIDSFRSAINDSAKEIEVVDVLQEARLSHIGIVPESRRFSTFLIDIGSGNTKGGYFPNDDIHEFKLFQLSWGTKSTVNATEKRLDADKSVENFNRQLAAVIDGSASDEIIYAINYSGAYDMNDNIAFSGGIAWSVATLTNPELIDNPVIPVTYEDVEKFYKSLLANNAALSELGITGAITDPTINKEYVAAEVQRVNKVFDQWSLLAGTALLLKIMRQFEGVYEKKQFYLVKNGQVGWISAYVNQHIVPE